MAGNVRLIGVAVSVMTETDSVGSDRDTTADRFGPSDCCTIFGRLSFSFILARLDAIVWKNE